MGNMSDEMRKVIDNWGKEYDPATDTKGQSVQTQTTAQTNNEFKTYRSEVYDYIRRNPKATTARVLAHMTPRHPVTHSSISSQLTTMFNMFMLTREQVFDPATQRNVYGYTAVDLKVAERMRHERDRKLAAKQARMERARQAKAEKAKERERAAQQQMNLPLETAPAPIPAPTTLSGMTAMQILQGINFAQAKELYKELHEAFGS